MKYSGFSLMEFVLTIGAFTILIGFSIPILNNYLSNNNLNNSLYTTTNALKRAKNLSIHQYYDTNWGIYIEDDSLILYSGDNYINRETQLDELYSLPNGIQISGDQDINFIKSNGYINSDKTITFNSNDESIVLSITSYGNISY